LIFITVIVYFEVFVHLTEVFIRPTLTMFTIENHGADLVKEAKLEADELAIRMADSIYFSSPEARASVQAAQAAAAAAAANPAPATPAAK